MTSRMGLIARREGLSGDAFRAYWRDRHGPLVASALPQLKAYWQNHVTEQLQRGIDYPRGPWAFDGFSQLWLDDAQPTRQLFEHGAAAAALIADEREFIGRLHIVTVEQTEVIAVPGTATRSRLLKRMSTLRRRDDISEDDFRREWKVHADWVRQMPGVSGYRQNVIVARERTKGTPCDYQQLPIDGIVELWFESAEVLERAFASPQGQRTMAHARSFLSEITAFVVQELQVV